MVKKYSRVESRSSLKMGYIDLHFNLKKAGHLKKDHVDGRLGEIPDIGYHLEEVNMISDIG